MAGFTWQLAKHQNHHKDLGFLPQNPTLPTLLGQKVNWWHLDEPGCCTGGPQRPPSSSSLSKGEHLPLSRVPLPWAVGFNQHGAGVGEQSRGVRCLDFSSSDDSYSRLHPAWPCASRQRGPGRARGLPPSHGPSLPLFPTEIPGLRRGLRSRRSPGSAGVVLCCS